jgi:predicted lysophospholipase L1 biosynthesis ABC-type transport system permease subunit
MRLSKEKMSTIRAQKDPPIAVAFSQAVKSIRLRFIRQAAAGFGVLLGIAFYTSVKTSQALSPVNPADPASVEAANRLEWLAVLSLLMCLVGITNSMLMSVTERYKEIGTLKCLGSSDGFIVKIFFIEALLIGAIASLAGAIVGLFIMSGIRLMAEGSSSFGARFVVDAFRIIATGFGIGVFLSALAAVLPAVQAAKMPAASALRVEI